MADNAIDYAAIRARLNAATEGPWFQGRDDVRHESARDVYSTREVSADSHDIATYISSAADAELIAHSRTDLEQLLDRVEEQDAILGRVQELHQPRVNSASALWPNPLCTCEVEYPCATVSALAAAPAAGEEKP